MKHTQVVHHAVPHRTQPQRRHGIPLVLVAVATFDAEPFVPFARVVEGMEVADALYAGYGERAGGGIRAGKQDPVFDGGNAYLRRDFPDLDYIQRATIELGR